MNHLGHKLPWDALNDALIFDTKSLHNGHSRIVTNESGRKMIEHFTRCFETCLKEFAETDKSSPEDLKHYDPSNWGDGVLYGAGGHMGYICSIILTYIQLNLLVLDYKKYEDRTFGGYQVTQGNWSFRCCIGDYDGGHPDWIAEQFQKIYIIKDRKYAFVEMNQENMKLINEYMKLLFRCLYTHVKNNPEHTIDADKIKNNIYSLYGIYY